MIERVEGEFLECGPGYVIVNLGGLGIRVQVPRNLADRLEGRTRGILLTRLVVREGDPQLYGFGTTEERAAFDALLSVSGVGPRIALAILSSLDAASLALEAERGGMDQLLLVPGVGKKLAARIVLELRGKLPALAASPSDSPASREGASIQVDAIRALTALGYAPDVAREAIRAVLGNRKADEAEPSVDLVLREALTRLNRRG